MSKRNFVLNAQSRDASGRSASRCLRRQDQVPGILYGAKKDPQALTISHNELMHSLEHEAFYSSIIDLKVNGNSQKAIIKDLQRHPYKPKLMHVDFLRIDENTEIHIHVPLHYVGTCPAVAEGGVINHLLNEVEVVCLPKDLPEFLEVDVSNLQLDETVHLSDLKVPAGVKLVELVHNNDAAIANVHIPRAVVEEEPVVAAPAEGEAAAAAPAAGAPGAAPAAAGAKPAAAPAAKKEEKK